MRMATMTRAMQVARGLVEEELKRQRVRIADVEGKEITARAKDYLIAHPELVVEARPVVESWFARGVFGKRAQKEFINTPHSTLTRWKVLRASRGKPQ